MKTKLKRTTYNGLIYTVEEIQDQHKECDEYWYKLSGIGWVKKSDCTHWLSGWFTKFFKQERFIIGFIIFSFIIYLISVSR